MTYSDDSVAIVDGENVVLGGKKNLYVLPNYTLLDLRAGVVTSDNRWRLTLWGRNVTDEFYLQNASTTVMPYVRGRPA